VKHSNPLFFDFIKTKALSAKADIAAKIYAYIQQETGIVGGGLRMYKR